MERKTSTIIDPTNIPKMGRFWNHDNRFDNSLSSPTTTTLLEKGISKKKNKESKMNQKWTHDKFEQSPQLQPRKKIEKKSNTLVVKLNHAPREESIQGNYMSLQHETRDKNIDWMEKKDSQETMINESVDACVALAEDLSIDSSNKELKDSVSMDKTTLIDKSISCSTTTPSTTNTSTHTTNTSTPKPNRENTYNPFYYNDSNYNLQQHVVQPVVQPLLMMTDTGLYVPTQNWNGYYYPSWNYPLANLSENTIQPRVNKAVKIRKP